MPIKWVVVPNTTTMQKDIVETVKIAGANVDNYLAVIAYPYTETNRIHGNTGINLKVSFYSVSHGEVRRIPATVAEVYLEKVNSVRFIYSPEIYYSPRNIYLAWRNFFHSAEKVSGSRELQNVMTESEYARSIIVPVLSENSHYDVVFISDHFPPEKYESMFNVVPYKVYPRSLILNGNLVDNDFTGSVSELKELIKKAENMLYGKGIWVVPQVSDMLRIIFSRIIVPVENIPSLGKFLVTGPPGVGKTTFAKELAKVLFGSEEMFARVDLNTFRHGEHLKIHLFSDDMGISPLVKLSGYRRGVLLWDEADKVDETAFDLLMQVLEEDYITLYSGDRVYIGNIVHIFTSNKFIEEKHMGLVKQKKSEGEEYVEGVKRLLSEPFMDRIDKVIYMGPPDEEGIRFIVEDMANRVISPWMENRENIIEEAKAWVYKKINELRANGKMITPRLIEKLLAEYVAKLLEH